MKKHYSMDSRYVFGDQKQDYVLLAQDEEEAVPHLTGIMATDPMNLQDLVNLLNICPEELIERAKAMNYEMMTGKKRDAA